jgi:hypothetical protein
VWMFVFQSELKKTLIKMLVSLDWFRTPTGASLCKANLISKRWWILMRNRPLNKTSLAFLNAVQINSSRMTRWYIRHFLSMT